jgi:hypothetical protein
VNAQLQGRCVHGTFPWGPQPRKNGEVVASALSATGDSRPFIDATRSPD